VSLFVWKWTRVNRFGSKTRCRWWKLPLTLFSVWSHDCRRLLQDELEGLMYAPTKFTGRSRVYYYEDYIDNLAWTFNSVFLTNGLRYIDMLVVGVSMFHAWFWTSCMLCWSCGIPLMYISLRKSSPSLGVARHVRPSRGGCHGRHRLKRGVGLCIIGI
jgi:CDP-diglyceride synthetase